MLKKFSILKLPGTASASRRNQAIARVAFLNAFEWSRYRPQALIVLRELPEANHKRHSQHDCNG